ncbi:MAG: DUF2309 domain-containing protein [Nisaea sp.]|uniref:YbcC family protein n=1 Tax=Nisaea sp. TaxID=2024842 RepID=UPI001B0D0D64|nr:DUF2309 domain-containing protein [Nisaea sp.]MBO6561062.1 DUF2309 domain-containing protein [Nisaea sp.]
MTKVAQMSAPRAKTIVDAANAAARAVPPLWPLSSSVAVNPFLGQTGKSLAETGRILERVAGARATMPREWYARLMEEGRIADEDLRAALAEASERGCVRNLEELKAWLRRPREALPVLPTIADLAAELSGIDWPEIIAERISTWAAGYFDQGQALWAAQSGNSAFDAWRAFAQQDLTPEIAGLAGFARRVASLPPYARSVAEQAGALGGLGREATETYFHRLFMTLGGWAQLARYRLWQAELDGRSDGALADLLAIRLVFEDALLDLCGDALADRWEQAKARYGEPGVPTDENIVDAILQSAAERAEQRRLGEKLGISVGGNGEGRPKLQAAFCIDVRSEVFRRALESVDPGIRTVGFAGFFGVGVSYRRFASDVDEARLPVLLKPALRACAGGHGSATENRNRLSARTVRAWGRFKLAAVSSFAFVEAAGIGYVIKLIRDALALKPGTGAAGSSPRFETDLALDDRVDIAERALRGMSLTHDLAPLVLIAGHGASAVNNPHASALNCGACGGYSGEANARLLASLLNDADVRAGLAGRDLDIPGDTRFVAALHDTTTDRVTLYHEDLPRPLDRTLLGQTRKWLDAAGQLARAERALRLPRAKGAGSVLARARDWSEVRPEWGLAGCSAFIAAPRNRTAGKDFAGTAFLHDYDWRQDGEFALLELILTAPVVVASWISLQYYGSAVAPEVFGGGNKLLHNVVGGFGVVEGNGGVLRSGLPWQSVHDGERLVHQPLRLSVCVEAPTEAINDVLARHHDVRALFENGWLHLFALDDAGRMAWRYRGGREWAREASASTGAPEVSAAE